MLAPEFAKAFIEMEFPNSQGKVSRPESPILIGNPSMITTEHISLSTAVDIFSNSIALVITSLANLGILSMDLRNGALIKIDSSYSMNFFCSSSKLCLTARDGNDKGG